MKKPVDVFEARRESAKREILTPPFPADVTHYDDGSWECSKASFDLMSQSYKRFGFELDYRWSFDTLYANFSFVLRAASLMLCLDQRWLAEKYTPEFVEYLQAVGARDDVRISQSLQAALLDDEARRQFSEEVPTPAAPAKSTVIAEDGALSASRRRLHLVQT